MARPQREPISAQQFRESLEAARAGSAEALGQLLEPCRPYLLLMANESLSGDLRAKIGPSDLVQETFLKAHGHFEQFQGGTEKELLAWLRRILLNHLANVERQYRGADKRQASREVALTDAPLDCVQTLADDSSTPSQKAAAREQDEALQRALAQLPETYRQVILLRNYERCPFEEIGQRLNRSADAAQKLWTRAIDRLQELLEAPDAASE